MRFAIQLIVALGLCVASIVDSSNTQSRRAVSGISSANANNTRVQSIQIPKGAELLSFPVGSSGASAAVYWTRQPVNERAQTAYIMVHGRLRDGGNYFKIMRSTLSSAIQAGVANVSEDSIIVAPQFWAETPDKGRYLANEMRWTDNGWSGGGYAVRPSIFSSLSSIDVLDALVQEFHNTTRYPAMAKIVITGHGGGGQLLQRYALVGRDSILPIRYISGNPSSAAYFTKDRPASEEDKLACPEYNLWRYGMDGFAGTSDGLLSIQDLFARYVQRDVVNIVSLNDTSDGGDQSCGAVLQGGKARRSRNLSWWKYLNTLAGTARDTSLFPGNFSTPIPDWSHLSGGVLAHRIITVPDAHHNPRKVFRTADVRSALFGANITDILSGWLASSPAVTPDPSSAASSSGDSNITDADLSMPTAPPTAITIDDSTPTSSSEATSTIGDPVEIFSDSAESSDAAPLPTSAGTEDVNSVSSGSSSSSEGLDDLVVASDPPSIRRRRGHKRWHRNFL